MKRKLPSIVSIIVLLALTDTGLFAQQEPAPFRDEIDAFKRQDSIHPPPKNEILFIGSSSFNKWTDVQDYFPGFPIINRGFGGSSLPDVIRYAGEIIYPYEPREIVIYCGENDLAASDTVTPQLVANRFKTLFGMIRNRFKKIPVVFVSIKPSPSRQRLMPRMEETNRLVRAFLKKKKKAIFIDVYHKMLTKAGQPIPSIFLDDSLHMNQDGYHIWQNEIAPHLLK